ncbi:DUF4274 domain-containing protein [Hymenobacter edaphi]|uniref:DUF4274 domain-containing protein n=1 Tax=Hymenobacter edaphi TaxID=2211146 RepID=A0A328BIW8_9BACT|nr:DUF4274 domain-containing protein [Hymenobacter edaphi]RAK65854.1 hypothetical protein DLM85_14140 [Hymenobacter edaphi]
MYFLSKSRTDFIQTHFIGTAAKGMIPDLARFQQLRSAAELHYLADAYNWDDGVTVLDWVINSPTCDYGTALLIFWRAQPDFYTEFANEQEADEEGFFSVAADHHLQMGSRLLPKPPYCIQPGCRYGGH